MYTFIDQDKRTINIEKDEANAALNMADDFRKWKINNNQHAEFHKKRRMYWEDFYSQLKKLMS